jgi:AraC family transcriptional regulator
MSQLEMPFKRNTGFAVHESVMRRRVERASHLLSSGKLSSFEIATQAGFSHQSHMARSRRRIAGTTPRELLRKKAGG